MPTDDLIRKVEESIEELCDAVHDAVLKSRPGDAEDYALALSSTTGAYRDLMAIDADS